MKPIGCHVLFALWLSISLPLVIESMPPAVSCPKDCECEVIRASRLHVYCFGGNLNQTEFSRILQALPLDVHELYIKAPRDRPNNFYWNDNLNRLTALNTLRLINCGIPAISRVLRLPKLEILDLGQNHIDHASMSVFSGVPGLRQLDLSLNRLNLLPTGAFNYLKNLRSLSLAFNNMTELATNLFTGLDHLEALHLDGNSINVVQLSSLLTDVPSLRRLELGSCDLSLRVNDLVLLNHRITRLGLGYNNLAVVPIAVIRQIPSLEILDLAGNQIRSLPGGVFDSNGNLTRLLVRDNLLGTRLHGIQGDSFKGLVLEEIDLSFNQLDDFDSSMLGDAATTIRRLHLSG